MTTRSAPSRATGCASPLPPRLLAFALVLMAVLAMGWGVSPAQAQPTVTDLRPQSGAPGTQVRIYGAGFSTADGNVVEIAGTSATIESATSTDLTVTIPSGISGVAPVRVSSDGGASFTTAAERVSVITGGTGAFAPDSSLGTITASDVARGDVDGDGDLDLLVTGTREGTTVTQLYINDGNGSFTEASSTGLPDLREGTVDLGDVDNDGDLDVLLTGVDNSTESVVTALYTKDDNALNYTNVTGLGLTGIQNGDADFGDLDNDGDLDIVLAGNNNGSAEASLYTNRLAEEESLDFTQATASLTGTTSSTVDIDDLNNDGALDLVITGDDNISTSSTLYVNENNNDGDISFSSTSPPLAVENGAVDVGDVNNDGAPDLVVSGDTSGFGNRTTKLLLNGGDGTFSTEQSLPGITNGSVTLGDVNADGNLDLLITGDKGGDFPERTILYTGDGSSSSPFSETRAGLTDVSTSAAVLGDFNGNGRLTPFIAGFGPSRPSATLYRSVLSLTNKVPPLNATSVPPSQNISLTFNAPVAGGAGLADSVQVTGSQSGALDGTVSGTGTNSLVYDPAQAFAPGERVSVTLRPGIESTEGVSLFRADGFRFRAAAPSGPAAFPLRRGVSDDETGAREVATGDLTGNGHLDLVVGSTGDAEVTLYPGNGDGTFGAPNVLAPSIQARALTLTDLTGDGRLDIVVGSGESESSSGNDVIRYYVNQGGGSFGGGTDITDGGSADDVRDLAAADIGNDGDRDLVAVTQDNSSVLLYRNDGNESFTEVKIDNGNIGDPRAVALADIDQDGTTDVVAGSASNDNIVWYANQGDGTFDFPQTLDAAVNPRSLRTADVDGDQRPEVLSAERGDDGSAGDGDVAVYDATFFNFSSPSWTKTSVTPTGTTIDSALAVAPADVNADGKIDIVAGSVDGDSLVWYENTTDGPLSFAQARTIDTGRPGVQDVVAADVDGDGSLDPITASVEANTVAVYPNVEPLRISGTTPSANAVDADTALSALAVTFNKPIDAASVDAGSVALFGDQTGRIGTASVGASGNTVTIDPAGTARPGESVTLSVRADSLADTDGVRLDSTYTVSFRTLPESGSGSFAPVPARTALTGVTVGAAEWGDVDGDGDLDAVITGEDPSGSVSAVVYENRAGGLDTLATLPGVGQSAGTSADWGDYDGDGDLDLIITGTTGGGSPSATIYRNDGGAFTDINAGLTGVSDGAADWGDFDGDGDLDLVVVGNTSASAASATLYENRGDTDSDNLAEFVSIGAGLTGVRNGSVAWGDYDNDGVLDLIITGGSGSTTAIAAVYHHDGQGTFSVLNKNSNGNTTGLIPAGETSVGAAAGDSDWGDIDGDGDLDLIITGRSGGGTPYATLFENDVENNNGFTDLQAGLTGVENSSADWGDYDGDGDLDVVVTGLDNTSSGTTRIYENQAGGFATLGAGLTGVEIGAADWGDYDGDGTLDLLVTGRDSSPTATARLYGQSPPLRVTGTTPARNTVGVDTSLGDIAVTFDKPLDLAATADKAVRVSGAQTGRIPGTLELDGGDNSELEFVPDAPVPFQPGEAVHVSVLADRVAATDGTVLNATETFRWTAQAGTGPAAFPVDDTIVESASAPSSVQPADLDGDGDLDVVASLNGSSTIAWYENDGTGSVSSPTTITTTLGGATSVHTTDLDGDGDPDVAAVAEDAQEVVWYENEIGESGADGDGFGAKQTISTNVAEPNEVYAADVDGDGDPDLLSASWSDNRVAWYENEIGESGADTDGFGRQYTITTSLSNPNSVRAGDFDGDGDPDVLAGSESNGTVTWFENQVGEPGADPDGFGSARVIDTGVGFSEPVRIADINGDGALDALVAGSDDSIIAWYENELGESGADGDDFGAQQGIADSQGSWATAADVDGDGDLDVIGSGGSAVSWYENDGTGGFGPEQTIVETGGGVEPVRAADLNGDGTLDVLRASTDGNMIGWHPNTTIAPQVVTEAASATTDSSAVAEAAVNPGGLETTITFQYGTDTTFGPDSTVTATTSLTGDDTTAVNATISGLDPATTYNYRVVASNSAGSTTGGERSVTTDIAPPSTVNDTVTTPEDTPVAVDVLSNDTVFAPLDTSTLAVQTAPPLGATSVDPSNGTITYTPAPDSTGPVQFGYTVADDSGNVSNEATVAVTVSPVNDAPVARADTFATADGQTLSVAAPGVLANDTDLEGDALSVAGLAQAPTRGEVSLEANGAFTYTPNDGYLGPDSLTYTLADANGATSTGTVILNIREATLRAGTDTSRFAPRRLNRTGPEIDLTVSNAGAVVLTNITAAIGGPNADDFTLTDAGGSGPLAPGDSRSYTVSFSPSAVGLREAALEVTAAEEDTTRTVALRGRGVEVAVRAGPADLDSGASVALSIEGGFAPTDGRLFFRAGGTDTYRDTALTVGPSDSLRAAIPQDAVTRRGIDYYLVLADDAGTLTIPAGGPATAAAQPRHLPATFETLSPPTALRETLFRPETYRMVSVPARPNGGIKAALKAAYGGSYAPARWRLERWRPGPQAYAGYPALDSLRPGNGFWLTTADGKGFSLPTGRTPRADTARTIRLEAGWNQIGTPFGFAVPWDTIQAASPVDAAQIDGPVGYADSTFRPGRAALAPWKGYFVYNATGEPDILIVPPVGPDAAEKSGASTPRPEAQLATAQLPGTRTRASNESKASSAGTDGRYTLRVEALSAGGNAQAHLGLWPEATAGRGPYDHAQPPTIHGGLRLSALQTVGGRSVPHAYSMKPPRTDTDGGGRHWTLRLSAPGTDGTQRAKLRLRDRGTLPEGYQRYILDLTAGRRIAPGAELSVNSGEPRRLKVIVGTRRYAQKNNEGVSLESLQTALRGNYPNPFSKQTTVEYVIAEEQPVIIEVYDVLGRRVRTLVDDRQALGVHRASLDARRLGSGVYFLRLRAGDASDTKKVVLVK